MSKRHFLNPGRRRYLATYLLIIGGHLIYALILYQKPLVLETLWRLLVSVVLFSILATLIWRVLKIKGGRLF